MLLKNYVKRINSEELVKYLKDNFNQIDAEDIHIYENNNKK